MKTYCNVVYSIIFGSLQSYRCCVHMFTRPGGIRIRLNLANKSDQRHAAHEPGEMVEPSLLMLFVYIANHLLTMRFDSYVVVLFGVRSHRTFYMSTGRVS